MTITFATCQDCRKPIARDPNAPAHCCEQDCGWYHVKLSDTWTCKGTSVHVMPLAPEWAKPGETWARTPQGGWYQTNRPAFVPRGDDDAPIVAAEGDSDTQPDPYIDAMAAEHNREYEPWDPAEDPIRAQQW